MLDSFRRRRCSTTSQELSVEEQMDVLREKLQMLQGHSNVHGREKALRKELYTLRRQQQKHKRKNSGEWGAVTLVRGRGTWLGRHGYFGEWGSDLVGIVLCCLQVF